MGFFEVEAGKAGRAAPIGCAHYLRKAAPISLREGLSFEPEDLLIGSEGDK